MQRAVAGASTGAFPHVGFVLKHNGKEHLRVSPVKDSQEENVGEEAFRKRANDVLKLDQKNLCCHLQKSDKYGSVEALISPLDMKNPLVSTSLCLSMAAG